MGWRNYYNPWLQAYTVTGAGGSTTITTDNGTLQLTATVTPSDATNKTVTWSVVNGTGQATINTQDLSQQLPTVRLQPGLRPMTAVGVVGSLVITISNQVIPVTGITVTGAGGSSLITTDNGTLQLTATVTPIGCHEQDSHMVNSQRHGPGYDQHHRTCHSSCQRNGYSQGHGQ